MLRYSKQSCPFLKNDTKRMKTTHLKRKSVAVYSCNNKDSCARCSTTEERLQAELFVIHVDFFFKIRVGIFLDGLIPK